jgi:hypothetical protein
MFPYPIATPQGCNIQTFYGTNGTEQRFSWIKPVGVSHVYMMLIGAGGTGDGTNGGGSGAVTVWYGAAQHVPNYLLIRPATSDSGGTSSTVYYWGRNEENLLLTANQGSDATAGTATTAGRFAASGFYKSTAGQDGFAANTTASTTTFLSSGTSQTGSVTANYGYSLPTTTGDFVGIFQMQPIIVGLGSKGTAKGAIGCGGGLNSGVGGPGMVLIASW